MLTTLLAFQQADAAFPSGAFAFSNGIEGLAALSPTLDRAALQRYIELAIRHRWAGFDRVALVRAWRAKGDLAKLAAVDDAVEAGTFVKTLREGSRRAGRALLTSHVRLATPGAEALRAGVADGRLLGHLAVLQGTLYRALSLSERDAIAVSGYQAITGLTTAAVRLGRIGAIEAQRVLRDTLPLVAALAEGDPIDDGRELESFVPFLDIAAMHGAEAEIRLFAS